MVLFAIYLWHTNTEKEMARNNRSKYNFSKMEMGGTMVIKAIDLYSMKNSLRFYNKTHKQNLTVEYEELESGDIKATRVPAKPKKR